MATKKRPRPTVKPELVNELAGTTQEYFNGLVSVQDLQGILCVNVLTCLGDVLDLIEFRLPKSYHAKFRAACAEVVPRVVESNQLELAHPYKA